MFLIGLGEDGCDDKAARPSNYIRIFTDISNLCRYLPGNVSTTRVHTALTLHPVDHDWVMKGFGIFTRGSATGHINDPLPPIIEE